MSKLLSVEQASYAYYELGKRQPKLNDFTRICRVLNVSADWMLGLDDTETPISVEVSKIMADADRLIANANDIKRRAASLS